MNIVIYGANDIGNLIATEFFEDHDITIIDNQENLKDDFSKLDINFIFGSGSNIETLKKAQIEYADIFIACTNSDETNIISCISVKNISEAQTVCFISNEDYIESLNLVKGCEFNEKVLIDDVIRPENLLTQQIFRLITTPEAISIENFAYNKAALIEYRIKENSIILNKKVKDCHFPPSTLIVGITRDNKLFIPNGETTLELNDKAIFMGASHNLDILAAKFFIVNNKKVETVTIIGGGRVGFMLGQNLEELDIKTKIIEKNFKQCEFLSQHLPKTLVLHGDGKDLELLKTEDVGESDVVVCVTNNDEKNLLCSLLVKQLGAGKIITRVSEATNISLFEKVGIDVAVSPKFAAINEIKHTIVDPDKGILTTVEQGLGEILQVSLSEKFQDTLVMNLKMPSNSLIAIIERRNNVIIPMGNTLLRAYDKLIIFTTSDNAQNVKNFFEDN